MGEWVVNFFTAAPWYIVLIVFDIHVLLYYMGSCDKLESKWADIRF